MITRTNHGSEISIENTTIKAVDPAAICSGALWWHVYDNTVPESEWRWLLIEVKQGDGPEPLPREKSIGRVLWDSTGVKWWDGWAPCEVRKGDTWRGPVLPPNDQTQQPRGGSAAPQTL